MDFTYTQEEFESLKKRFWAKVDKNGPVPAHCPELEQCWLRGRGKPYGGCITHRGRNIGAHRISWLISRGYWNILQTLHKCDGGKIGCVRPDHLFAGTARDNMQDMTNKQRHPEPALSESLVREEILPAIQKGETYRDIGKKYSVSDVAIRHIAIGKTYTNIQRRPEESRHPRKLTYENAETIRRRVRAGERYSVLEMEYDVKKSTISRIVHEIRWPSKGLASSSQD